MKNKDKEKILDDFLSNDEKKSFDKKMDKEKYITIKENDNSIIERVDKIFVTKTGKQLLREQY